MAHQKIILAPNLINMNLDIPGYSCRNNILAALGVSCPLLDLEQTINHRIPKLPLDDSLTTCISYLKLKTRKLNEKIYLAKLSENASDTRNYGNMGNSPNGDERNHFITSLIRCCCKFMVKWKVERGMMYWIFFFPFCMYSVDLCSRLPQSLVYDLYLRYYVEGMIDDHEVADVLAKVS